HLMPYSAPDKQCNPTQDARYDDPHGPSFVFCVFASCAFSPCSPFSARKIEGPKKANIRRTSLSDRGTVRSGVETEYLIEVRFPEIDTFRTLASSTVTRTANNAPMQEDSGRNSQ